MLTDMLTERTRVETRRERLIDAACRGVSPLFGVETEYAADNYAMEAMYASMRMRNDLKYYNGAILYEDCDHPEYATPPCNSPARLAREWEKGHKRVARACRAGRNFVGRACAQLDDGETVTWGFHENYSFGVRLFHDNPLLGSGPVSDYGADAVAEIMFLSRACWAGVGGLVPRPRETLVSMSPRLVELARGHRNHTSRESKNEAVEDKERRAHVVMADTPMDGDRLGVRVGATWLLLAARMASRNAEEALSREELLGPGQKDATFLADHPDHDNLELLNLLDDMRRIAAGGMLVDADNIRRMAAAQQRLLDETRRFWRRRAGRPRWASRCLDAWATTVARARRGNHSTTDWGIKLATLRRLGLAKRRPGGRFAVPETKLNRAIEADARFGQLPTGMFEIATGRTR